RLGAPVERATDHFGILLSLLRVTDQRRNGPPQRPNPNRADQRRPPPQRLRAVTAIQPGRPRRGPGNQADDRTGPLAHVGAPAAGPHPCPSYVGVAPVSRGGPCCDVSS